MQYVVPFPSLASLTAIHPVPVGVALAFAFRFYRRYDDDDCDSNLRDKESEIDSCVSHPRTSKYIATAVNSNVYDDHNSGSVISHSSSDIDEKYGRYCHPIFELISKVS
jgi:hypothetical protein